MSERESKLDILKKLRQDSKKDNKKIVKNDFQKKAENPKAIVRNQRKLEEAEKLLFEKETKEQGKDIDRIRGLNWSIEDVEKWEEKQLIQKQKVDLGFTDYQQVAAKKYKRLTNDLKPNLPEYNKRKNELEYSLSIGLVDNHEYKIASSALENKPSDNSVNRMVKDLDKQIEKRFKFSRRKAVNPDEDVTYINDRNMKFNQKISRAYDKYTTEIKAAFERGTALE